MSRFDALAAKASPAVYPAEALTPKAAAAINANFGEHPRVRLALPYPPSANRYWRLCRGRVVKSAEARAYQALVRQLGKTFGAVQLKGDVKLSLWVVRPQKRGDLSNRLKVLEDALQGVTYANDDQVVEIHAFRLDDKNHGRIVVEVEAA